ETVHHIVMRPAIGDPVQMAPAGPVLSVAATEGSGANDERPAARQEANANPSAVADSELRMCIDENHPSRHRRDPGPGRRSGDCRARSGEFAATRRFGSAAAADECARYAACAGP